MLKFFGSYRVIFPFDWYLDSRIMEQQCGACVARKSTTSPYLYKGRDTQ